MSTATMKYGRFSPSSVAHDWLDRASRSPSSTKSDEIFVFPKEIRDLPPYSKEPSLRASEKFQDVYDGHRVQGNVESKATSNSNNGSGNKCRQLPCRTFISTGSCPYGDRCVFLHDPSIMSKPVFIKIKRKSKEDTVTDTFFWPTMPLNLVMSKLDSRNQPDIAQPYIVPAPGSYNEHNSINDAAVFSMWEHFVDFLASDSLSVVTQPRAVPPLNPLQLSNPYSGKRRLSVLVHLAQGLSISS